MARKASNKLIAETFSKIAADYFAAANAKGIGKDTEAHMTNKWAVMREVAYILATKDRKQLDKLAEDAARWKKDCLICGA